jgi:hypothetical protein
VNGILSGAFSGFSLLVFGAFCAGCPPAALTLSPDLLAAAQLERAPALKAAAWLIGSGQMRVNIEPEAEAEGSCGVSLFIKAADPERATLEIRCPGDGGKGRAKDAGAMDTIFEKNGFSVASWPCKFVPESLDFSPDEETENAGCFVAETDQKRLFKGCFSATGLWAVQKPNRLKPVTK